jgi:hypothetical protein
VKRFWWIWIVLVVLVGCQPVISTVTLAAPEVWRVQVSPALRWLNADFHACAATFPNVTLLYDEKPGGALNPAQADFSIGLEPAKGAAYTAILGRSEMTVIVNPANPLSQLSLADLKAIFSGKDAVWADLANGACPECTASTLKAIQPYVYADGDEVARVVESLIPGLTLRQPNALLAPNPQAVRQAVAGDPQAIGLIPAFWLDGTVRAVTISDPPSNGLHLPIVFSGTAEPAGAKLSWLLCVEQSIAKPALP